MTALSIRNMNWTEGQRETESTIKPNLLWQMMVARNYGEVEPGEINEQIRILKNITPAAQAEYFAAILAQICADIDWLDVQATNESVRP